MEYQEFLASKKQTIKLSGFGVDEAAINAKLFKFQSAIVRWALNLGKAAIFAECGLGKTAMQLEWAKHVHEKTDGKVLILTPLAVAEQTVREGVKFDVPVQQVREAHQIGGHAIVVTNYERLHLFDVSAFAGVVLDESSILKAYTGKTKQQIIAAFKDTPYKLACTATPAPNDHLELGNHADFLDIMPSNEMISRWFINDTMSAGSYRLKQHAAADFWRWLTSWAVCISRPGDLGPEYEMPEFELPKLNIVEHRLNASQQSIERAWGNGRLMPDTNPSSTTLHKVKRESLADRVARTAQIVKDIPADDAVIIWCDTNYEADALIEAFPEAVEVRGSHSPDSKARNLREFSEGKIRMIISKPDLAGFGLNWQHCHNAIYAGVGFSFEKLYQSMKRTYRFGQEHVVNTHIIYAETEGSVMAALNAKSEAFKVMQEQMNAAMHEHGLFRKDGRLTLTTPESKKQTGAGWTMYMGDCIEEIKKIDDNSVDLSVFSPPFANLYIYSDSEADMGNSSDDAEFFQHFAYLVPELFRITRPGRNVVIHCKDLPAYMNRDGNAGLRDFPGEIIRMMEMFNLEAVTPPDLTGMSSVDAYRAIVDWQRQVEAKKGESAGFRFHSRVNIWKDPVIEMQRTKNHGLLHKNFAERAEACRQGMSDYLLVFRKWPIEGGVSVKQNRQPGDYIGTEPPSDAAITNGGRRDEQSNYSITVWQKYASPVWFDIDQTNVLNFRVARDNEDEKHICPLQLDVIARSIDLWSNEGDTVFSPFAGIGSEGYEALKLRRKFIGIELKESYFDMAVKYLTEAEQFARQKTLFEWAGVEVAK